MLRWMATILIGILFGLNLVLPSTSIGRRGTSADVRADVAGVMARVGEALPAFEVETLEGRILRSQELLGHRVLLIFERSVDW